MMTPEVLIVDDQPLVLGVVQEILSRGLYHVSDDDGVVIIDTDE